LTILQEKRNYFSMTVKELIEKLSEIVYKEEEAIIVIGGEVCNVEEVYEDINGGAIIST